MSIWQVVAGSVMSPPARLMAVAPALAPVTVPPQVFIRPGVAATVRLAGKLSLHASPVRLATLLLVTTMRRTDDAPGAMNAGMNDLTRVGWAVNA